MRDKIIIAVIDKLLLGAIVILFSAFIKQAMFMKNQIVDKTLEASKIECSILNRQAEELEIYIKEYLLHIQVSRSIGTIDEETVKKLSGLRVSINVRLRILQGILSGRRYEQERKEIAIFCDKFYTIHLGLLEKTCTIDDIDMTISTLCAEYGTIIYTLQSAVTKLVHDRILGLRTGAPEKKHLKL